MVPCQIVALLWLTLLILAPNLALGVRSKVEVNELSRGAFR